MMRSNTEHAAALRKLGATPIPLEPGGKRPITTKWTETGPDAWQDILRPEHNLGVLLGNPSEGLVDVDVDSPEALLVTDLLPHTGLRHGRPGKPSSHFWYRVSGDVPGRKAWSMDTTIVELRGTGSQTMVPPSIHPDGDPLAWEEWGTPTEIAYADLRNAAADVASGALVVKHYPGVGSRHDMWLALSSLLIRSRMPHDRRREFIRSVCSAARDDEYEDRLQALGDTEKRAARGEACTGLPRLADILGEDCVRKLTSWLDVSVSGVASADTAGPPHDPEELRFVEAMAEAFATDMRYLIDESCWLKRNGAHWRRLLPAEADTAVLSAVRKLRRGRQWGHRVSKTIEASEASSVRIQALRERLRLDLRLQISQHDVVPQPHLLPVTNGVLDLCSGQFHGGVQERVYASIAPVTFDAGKTSEAWESFIGQTFGGDVEMIDFMQVLSGYLLTGDASAEKFFVFHGPAASGKSTFVEAMASVLGDFATTVNLDQLLAEGGQASEYTLAECFNRRLVSGAEWNSHKRLNEALVKLMAGGDTLAARRRYGDPFTFRPQFTLLASTNALPYFDASDAALLRRLTIVPFDHPIPPSERDPDLKRLFTDCPDTRSAILNWALEGARSWFEHKRFPPAHQVDDAHRVLRARLDPVGTFIEVKLRFVPTATTAVAELKDTLREWEERVGRPTPYRDVEKRLTNFPNVRRYKRSTMYFAGIELVRESDG